MYFHPICLKCQKQQHSVHCKHRLYTPALHRYCEALNIRARARCLSGPKSIAYGICCDDIMGLFLEQDGVCAVSGVRMSYSKPGARKKWTNASLDRIYSDRNYTLDNIQMVCLAVNTMKNEMTMDELRFWCASIVVHQTETDPAN